MASSSSTFCLFPPSICHPPTTLLNASMNYPRLSSVGIPDLASTSKNATSGNVDMYQASCRTHLQHAYVTFDGNTLELLSCQSTILQCSRPRPSSLPSKPLPPLMHTRSRLFSRRIAISQSPTAISNNHFTCPWTSFVPSPLSNPELLSRCEQRTRR